MALNLGFQTKMYSEPLLHALSPCCKGLVESFFSIFWPQACCGLRNMNMLLLFLLLFLWLLSKIWAYALFTPIRVPHNRSSMLPNKFDDLFLWLRHTSDGFSAMRLLPDSQGNGPKLCTRSLWNTRLYLLRLYIESEDTYWPLCHIQKHDFVVVLVTLKFWNVLKIFELS